MSDYLKAMSDLAYVKEMIEALSSEGKKELFHHFTKANTPVSKDIVRPATPTNNRESYLAFSKRPLNSPESPKRSKKDGKVLSFTYSITS